MQTASWLLIKKMEQKRSQPEKLMTNHCYHSCPHRHRNVKFNHVLASPEAYQFLVTGYRKTVAYKRSAVFERFFS